MKTVAICLAVSAISLVTGCASNRSASTPPQQTATATASTAATPTPRIVKSRDGSFEGEIIGVAMPGSRFSKLQIGMQIAEVQELLGHAPDRTYTYESGKRWIPFYFGNDARRMMALYKGEGCLAFTNGNQWGGSGGDLISIHHDASGNCYQP